MTLFDEPSRQPLPQPTFEDVKHAGRKGLVGMIPFVGSAGSELLALLSSPVAERRDDWFEDLERRLQKVEDLKRREGKVAGFRLDDLANNEQFVSATLQATQAALRTHQKEKLEALRNAVVNVAIGDAPSENRQTIFLNLIDRLTPAHIDLLTFLGGSTGRYGTNEHSQWVDRFSRGQAFIGSSEIISWIKQFTPKLANEPDEFIKLLLNDLYVAGLTTVRGIDGGLPARRINQIGSEFLKFITAPETK